jgi:hypothetical protein
MQVVSYKYAIPSLENRYTIGKTVYAIRKKWGQIFLVQP